MSQANNPEAARTSQPGATRPDSGTATNDVYIVQANDALSLYAQNLYERNPELREQFPAVNGRIPLWGRDGLIMHLVNFNNNLPAAERPAGWRLIRDANDRNCDGTPGRSPHLRVGQVFVYPEMQNEILEPGKPCVRIETIPPEQPIAPPPPPVTPGIEIPAAAEAPSLAQFVAAPGGAVDLGYNIQQYNYLFGRQPVDAAARGSSNADRLRGGALRPGEMEGQQLRLRTRDDQRDGGVQTLPEGGNGNFYFGRAQRQELTFRPQANYVWRDGVLVPSNRYNQKLEENLGAVVDGDGRLAEVVQGGALISLPRRQNPYHDGILTDYDTARNQINQWSATGEAVGVLTYYQAIQTQYPVIADRFLQGSEAPTAQDAEALLQLNVRTAMSPVFWSVSSRGVPVGNPQALAGAMEQVFSSPRFAELPAEEQQRLRSTYQPLTSQLGNPERLLEAVGGREALSAYYNPAAEIAAVRSQDRNIYNRYFDGNGRSDRDGRPEGVSRRDYRIQLAGEVGARYASELEQTGNRLPSPTERSIGTAVAFNTERQSADGIVAARTTALGRLQNDPQLLDDTISHVLNTPGALQKWTDPMFHATRGGARDNRRILGFGSDREADRYVRDAAISLGGNQFRTTSIDYRGSNPIEGLINFATLGLATPGANRNQNRGIADGFPEAVRERWVNGTDADREQIRGVFRDLAQRGEQAQQNGLGYAAASFMTSLDPRLAEYRGRDGSEEYRRITTALGDLPRDVLVQRENATNFLGAQVEMGTEQRVLSGQNIRTVDEQTATNAIANGTALVQGSDVAGISGISTLNLDAARQAREVGRGSGIVLSTANTLDRVGQGQTNRQVAVALAAADPTAFSMVTLRTMVDGGLEAASARNLNNYVSTIDEGNRDYSRYADMMSRHLRAIRRAGDDAGARAAAENAAASDLTAYFAADPRRAGASRGAANRLADLISNDGPVSATFSAQFQQIARETESPLASLNAEQRAQLQARLAATNNPQEAMAVLNAFQGELAGSASGASATSLNAAQIQSLSQLAGSGLPADQLNAQVGSILASNNTTLNAAQLQQLQAGLAGAATPQAALAGLGSLQASLNAGTGPQLNAAQIQALSQLAGSGLTADQLNAQVGSILASNNTSLNAGQLNALNSLMANPADFNANMAEFLAGSDADRGSLNARPGISWVKAVTVACMVFCPGGGDNPLIPDGGTPPCCGNVPLPPRPGGPIPLPPIPGR